MTDTTPKIYGAIHNILKEMQVEKNGTLPGNMGGKSYATAEAISNATKNLFVANNLILIPSETVTHVSSDDYGDKKMRYMVTITGNYRATHIEDGSFIEFSGTGQGIATGTAIAANVASTFSLKNALQRLFLISEDSVESAAHVEQSAPKQAQAQRTVKEAPSRPVVKTSNREIVEEIKVFMSENGIPSEVMSALNDKIAKERGKEKGEVLPELLERLKAGEVA